MTNIAFRHQIDMMHCETLRLPQVPGCRNAESRYTHRMVSMSGAASVKLTPGRRQGARLFRTLQTVASGPAAPCWFLNNNRGFCPWDREMHEAWGVRKVAWPQVGFWKKGVVFYLLPKQIIFGHPRTERKGGGAPPPFQAIRPWLEDIVFRKRSRNVTSYK